MSLHRFITIDGTRHEITGLDVFQERKCDRCGAFMEYYTAVIVPLPLVGAAEYQPASAPQQTYLDNIADDPNMKVPIPVELCNKCVATVFTGLLDAARKLLGRE